MRKNKSVKQKMLLSVIALVLCFACSIPVSAADEIEENAYLEEYVSAGYLRNTVVRTCSASLAISGSTATCGGTGSAYASMASSVKLEMYLQKDNSGWTTVASWSTTASGTTAILSKTATVSSGTYRVKVVCTAGGESITVYSTIKSK